MADRTVKTTLLLQAQQYISEWDKVQRKTRDSTTEAKAKLEQQRQAWDSLGKTALIAGGVVAAGVGLAIAKYAEFDKAMSNVQAATQESAANMGLLREAALDAGAKTVFTATEAAGAIEELGKNGLTTADILSGGLDAALSLASAGQIDVARAAEVTALSMKQFNLQGKDAGHIADLLAAGAGKAAGDVDDMAQALAQGGLVANSTGLSIEETTGVLAAFADKALIGSDAGTSLKTMLQRLTPQSAQAREEMDRLGISAYDAQGNFIGAAAFAGNLHDSLKKLTPEQRNASEAIIFGSDAVRAANVLYEEGAAGIQKYIDQTNDSGYAAKVAADRLDNLSGDVEKLGGSFDTALIKSGSGANDVLRGMVQSATFLVDSFGNLPQPVLDVGLALGTVGAATLLTGGAAFTAIPKIAGFKTSLEALKISAKGVGLAVGIAGSAITVATLVLGAFIEQQAQAAQTTDSFRDSLDKQTGAMTKYTRQVAADALSARSSFLWMQDSSALDDAKKLGLSLELVTDAALGSKKAMKELRDTEQNSSDTSADSALTWGHLMQKIKDTRDQLGQAKDDHKNLAAAQGENAKSAEEVAAATEAAAKAEDEWTSAVAGADASFIDLNGAYDAAMKKAQDLATETGKAQGIVGDALAGMAESATVSAGDFIAALQKQVDDQNAWESNMVKLASRVPQAMLQELNDLGPKGAAEVALMASMTDDELAKTVDLWGQRGAEATGAFANSLTQGAPTIAAVGAKYGQEAVNNLAAKLAAGEGIDEAMQELGLSVEEHPITPKVNTAPARDEFDNAGAYAEAMEIWMHVQGDTVPARSQFSSERDYQEGLKLWLHAHGETRPARDDFDSAKSYAEALQIYLTGLGNSKPARGDFDSAKAYGDALKAWITAMADIEPAEASLEQVANKKRYATIQAVIQGGTDAGQANAAYKATGGAIFGPGTGTSDSVPIMASNGEHMWTAAEVERARRPVGHVPASRSCALRGPASLRGRRRESPPSVSSYLPDGLLLRDGAADRGSRQQHERLARGCPDRRSRSAADRSRR
jgi:TP901 family phage tail tape measure protein